MLTPSYRYIIFSYSLLIMFVSPMKVYRYFLSPEQVLYYKLKSLVPPPKKMSVRNWIFEVVKIPLCKSELAYVINYLRIIVLFFLECLL